MALKNRTKLEGDTIFLRAKLALVKERQEKEFEHYRKTDEVQMKRMKIACEEEYTKKEFKTWRISQIKEQLVEKEVKVKHKDTDVFWMNF